MLLGRVNNQIFTVNFRKIFLSVMPIKRFKSPFSCVINPVTQPKVANQQKNIKKLKLELYENI